MPGRPKFSGYISEIRRGETYPQFEARIGEKLKIFVSVHTAAAPLGVGVTEPLLDFETFLPAPYTSPAGWLADFREWFFTYNGLVRLDLGVGDFPTLVLKSYPAPYEFTHEYEQIIFFNTKFWDPLAENEHEWSATITNEDTVELQGAAQVAMVLTDQSSRYPTHKKVKCPLCEHVNTVELEETSIRCTKCKGRFVVPFFPGKVI